MTALFALLFGTAILLAVAIAGQRMLSEWRGTQLVLTQRLTAMHPDTAPAARSRVPWLTWLEARIPAPLKRDLARADITIGPRPLIGYAVALALVAVAGLWRGGVLGMTVALLIGAATPIALVRYLAGRRMAAFVELLPHLLDSVRQLLMVGNSLPQAFAKATADAQPAVRRYLDPAIRRIANGAPIVDAIDTVAEHIDLAEMHMVVAAVRTNQRTGGSIAPMLTRLATLLRDRARVMRELKAASAETRLSAAVLCGLPPLAFLLISAINYDYMRYMWETAGGRRLLLIGLGFQAVGMLTMRRLMRLQF